MLGMDIFFIGTLLEILIFVIIFWKDLFQMLDHQKFYRIVMNYPSGNIKQFWYYVKDEKIMKYDKKIYHFKKTYKTFKGSKFFEYNEGDPFPIEEKPNIKENLLLDYERAKIDYSKIFEEKDAWIKNIILYIVIFGVGLLIGALGATVHMQQKIAVN